MPRFDGKVALISGRGRGQGRNHTIRLAGEGAHTIALDICHDIDSVAYDMSTPADLKETARRCEPRRAVEHRAGCGPLLIQQRRGGAVVLTSSAFGLTGRGGDGAGGYVASKHGVVGLMRTFANWLAHTESGSTASTPLGSRPA